METGDQIEEKTVKADNPYLQFYLSSAHYDCTFQVSDDSNEPRRLNFNNTISARYLANRQDIFKCHKLVLATASPVLEKLLYGPFKESSFGPDTAIELPNVSENAFDLAMRFIYGNSDDFKSSKLAVEVYKFAHEWQIDRLLAAATNFLDETEAENIIGVYDMYRSLGNIDEMHRCLDMIEESTECVLDSSDWLSCSGEAVLEILEREELKIGEKKLFDGLIKINENPAAMLRDEDEVNRIVKSGLKLIRFMAMSAAEFTSICKYKHQVLTTEEKLQIMLSINMHDTEQLPPGFATSIFPRNLIDLGHFIFDDGLPEFEREDVNIAKNATSTMTFAVMTKDRVFLKGFQLFSFCAEEEGSPKHAGENINFDCRVYKNSVPHVNLAKENFRGLDAIHDLCMFYFSEVIPLENMSFYSIEITYLQENSLPTEKYSPTQAALQFSDPNLTLHFLEKVCFEDICSLVLLKSDS